MLLKLIELQGFASYKEYSKVTIPMGITGIMGSIIDGAGNIIEGKSNGAGKSSIVMALLYALYGVGEYGKQEEIWNDRLEPKEEAFVKVIFELSGNSYEVTRGRKGKGAYVDVLENGTRVGDSNDEAQAFIVNLLGMDSKLFKVSVFFMQGDLFSFIETEPAVRKQYIDSILDLQIWRDTSKECKKRSDLNKKEKEDLLSSITILEDKINECQETIASLEQEVATISDVQREKEEKEKELERVRLLDNTLTMIKECEEALNSYTTSFNRAEATLQDIKIKIDATQEKYNKDFEAYNNYALFDFDLWDKTNTSLLDFKERTLTDIDTRMEKIADLSKKKIELSTKIELYKEGLLTISSGVCDKCKQPVSQEHINKHNEEKEEEIAVIGAELSSIVGEICEFEIELQQVRKNLADAEDDIGKHAEEKRIAEQKISAWRTLSEQYNETLGAFTTQLNALEEDKINYNAKIEENNNKLKDLKDNLPADNYNKEELLSSISSLGTKLQLLYAKQGVLETTRVEQEENKNNLKKLKDSLKNTEATLYYLQVLGSAFKDIPTAILKDSITEIEEDANEFIQSIFPDYRIKIYEDETKVNRPLLIAFEVDGKRRNYKLLSGGQRSICAIGLRIGFNKVISRRAKVSINFLILDEIFSALDGFNRTEVLKTFISLNKFFPQILAITHTEEASLFPNIIHVLMDENKTSRVLERR